MSQQIFPSNMALLQQKQKIKSAQKGRDLLKRKTDALKVQFRQILKQLIEKKRKLGDCYNDALIYLARANYSSSGEVSRTVEENVRPKTDMKLSLRMKNYAGVVCPEFNLRNIEEEKSGGVKGEMDILGLTGGGHTLNIAKRQFNEYLKLIIEIATLQTNYKAIDEALKITNRRVNALEYIVVPRIEGVINYIKTELSEREKEDKFRIKKVLENKKKHKEKEDKHSKTKQMDVVEDVAVIVEEEDEEEIVF